MVARSRKGTGVGDTKPRVAPKEAVGMQDTLGPISPYPSGSGSNQHHHPPALWMPHLYLTFTWAPASLRPGIPDFLKSVKGLRGRKGRAGGKDLLLPGSPIKAGARKGEPSTPDPSRDSLWVQEPGWVSCRNSGLKILGEAVGAARQAGRKVRAGESWWRRWETTRRSKGGG